MTTTTPPTRSKEVQSVDDVLTRYPILTAHLVCHSLGYFSPRSAARAILDHLQNRTNACEWYCHMASSGKDLKQVNTQAIRDAFTRRHYHKGYMADYRSASVLVQREIQWNQRHTLMAW